MPNMEGPSDQNLPGGTVTPDGKQLDLEGQMIEPTTPNKGGDLVELAVTEGPPSVTEPQKDNKPAGGEAVVHPFLRRFPITCLGISIGLGGNGLMWKTVAKAPWLEENTNDEAPEAIFISVAKLLNHSFWWLSMLVFLTFLGMYAVKFAQHRDVCFAEFANPLRANFFQAPGIIVLLLSLGVPSYDWGENWSSSAEFNLTKAFQTAGFTFGFFWQFTMVQTFYQRWMYHGKSSVGNSAAPPFLLSVISWFLLAVLGSDISIRESMGFDLPSMVLGIGVFFASIVYISIFQKITDSVVQKGDPSMFLMIAPISVCAIAISKIDKVNKFDNMTSKGLVGVAMFLFVLLLRSGPVILKQPAFFGVYWAYTFPLAALGSACTLNAASEKTTGARILAFTSIAIASFALITVFLRMSTHCGKVWQGKASWNDPLVLAVEKAKMKSENE